VRELGEMGGRENEYPISNTQYPMMKEGKKGIRGIGKEKMRRWGRDASRPYRGEKMELQFLFCFVIIYQY